MFNGVEYVREVCNARKIPISQLEKDCGFSNGYLNPKKMQKIPYDRAKKIAEYLNLPLDHLLNGPEAEEAPVPEGGRGLPHAKRREILAEGGMHLLMDADAKMPEEHLEEIVEFIKMKQRKYGR